jgi:hypothetical protein
VNLQMYRLFWETSRAHAGPRAGLVGSLVAHAECMLWPLRAPDGLARGTCSGCCDVVRQLVVGGGLTEGQARYAFGKSSS